MIIELTHKEPFPFVNHYENLSKQRYFKKYFVKLLGIPEVQLMRLGADVEADRAYLFNKKLLGDEMPAVQFHPPRSEYVNEHEHCLHIWASEDFSELWRRMGQKDYWRQR